ncbi:AAA family ATPase [Micromonospora sp. NPDC023814]|uniref:ATP-binding protein n=1 Tax=Micromonospora sp. NPDC023814 TaxID=3154596 RepID=UPI0033D55F2D
MSPANPADPDVWVGRGTELEVIRAAAGRLADGQGGLLWVEGESGIGKSSLVARALAGGPHQVLSATADELTQRFPLAVMRDCLGVAMRADDPRRAETAQLLHERRRGSFTAPALAAATYADIELLVALVDDLATERATALVLDDAQWADEASLALWRHLALGQLPLLLIAVSRPVPRTQALLDVRAVVERAGGTVLTVGPLGADDVEALVTDLVGGPVGPRLRELAGQALGNPLYLRELVDALVREGRVGPAGERVELSPVDDRLPSSFATLVTDRLRVVPAGAAGLLRAAALLGPVFSVSDLATVLGTPASELAGELLEASAGGILVGAGTEMAFRHPLIRQALYDGTPASLRAALHRQVAMALAADGADAERVAEQLIASGQSGDDAARAWLASAESTLTAQAPEVAADLLRPEVDGGRSDDGLRDQFAVALARALFAAGRYEEAATRAYRSATTAAHPDQRTEAHWLAIRSLAALDRGEEAAEALRRALSSPDLPAIWRGRLLALRAMFQRATDGDLDTAQALAEEALAIAERAGDAYGVAYALTNLWLILGVRRDHTAALRCVERALAVLGDVPQHADLRALALDSRVFSLQNLGRWADAEAALKQARDTERRSGYAVSTSHITTAVHRFWVGQWDDALAELGSISDETGVVTYSGLRETGPALLAHGVAALIAGRRNQRDAAAEHLRAGLRFGDDAAGVRENRDFLAAAHALALEQAGEPQRAISVLFGAVRRRRGEMTLTHQWLADLVRLCLSCGDRSGAEEAVEICAAESRSETTPARAAAAAIRCRGVLDGDPVPLREAVEIYRAAGVLTELTGTLEDLAAATAGRGAADEARRLLTECTALYETFGAEWDIRRADNRLRAYGVRRGVRGPRGRPTSGWEALTPTERTVAQLIAEGLPTTAIAQRLYLSRRTVQTHVSHILGKLGLQGRVEIAREAYRRAS